MSRPVVHAHAYPVAGRFVAALCVAVSGASLLVILALVVWTNDPPVTPPVLFRLVGVLVLVPAAGAWLVRRVTAVAVEMSDADLVLVGRGRRIEIPRASIARVVPWAVPLPEAGLSFRLRSGRGLRWGLGVADPTTVLVALGAGTGHPVVVYAHARASVPRSRWDRPLLKFVVLALAPAVVLFYTHQHIAYGAFLGEYYLLGLRAWLVDLLIFWGVVAVQLVLYASVWRGLTEAVALATAFVAPSRAARVRRMAEMACRAAYYAGVPILLLLRYLPG